MLSSSRIAALMGLALAALPAAALAGGSVTATAPASVTILAPVTLEARQALDFGSVSKPSTQAANTVTLDAAGNVTVSGAGDARRAAASATAASFNLVGPAGLTYSTTQTLTFAQAGLANARASAPVAANGALGVLPASGAQELHVGGAFDLSAATPVGAYTGALTVTVNYN
jgi:spore coat protein U-like protein